MWNIFIRVLVLVSFVVMAAINAIQSSSSKWGYYTNAEISNTYPTSFTPAGFTFSVWGVIYTFQALHCIYQFLPSQRNDETITALSPWLLLAFVCNAAWSIIFSYELYWTSVVVISLYLFALVKAFLLVYHLQIWTSVAYSASYGLNSYNPSPYARVIPLAAVTLNLSWVLLATLLDFSLTLEATTKWDTTPDWAVCWLTFAAVIAIYVSWNYANIPYILVDVWALIGIAKEQKDNSNLVYSYAIILIFVVLLGLIVGLVRERYEGKNMKSVNEEPVVGRSGPHFTAYQ